MSDKFTLFEFNKRFPDDDACLEEIKQLRYPDGVECKKCQKVTKHYRVKGRTAYACEFCGTHIFPLAGTIFEKTSTPLTYWFYAMYLMVQTRAGISAKQLEREFGVTYKTAWRIFKQIRMLMTQEGGGLLSGIVEVDETFMGGKGFNRRYEANFNEKPKEIVMGMVERGGKARTVHIPNTGKYTLQKQIEKNVQKGSHIMTDQFPAYKSVSRLGYMHNWINHHEAFVEEITHTQNAEAVWSNIKRGVYGVYRKVSKKYLQNYVDEYTFRYNNRGLNGLMFNELLSKVALVTFE